MAKSSSKYVCQQCGYSQVGWSGKCPECGAWGSLVETVVSATESRLKTKDQRLKTSEPVSLASVSTISTNRTSTKISELDRVLGGGLVPGQVILIAGEPGIGKSTLLLQVADQLAAVKIDNKKNSQWSVLYVSGEESITQIKIRADRLGIKNRNLTLLEETDIDSVIEIAAQPSNCPVALIIDSIQTMTTQDLSGMAGSVGQVRESASRLVRLAKGLGIVVFVVGHVTKQGSVAGPSVLMHIVDSVLWFEGERNLTFRVMRAHKNRFGPTDEVGVFSMEEKGLVSVPNPEGIFLTGNSNTQAGGVAGSVVTSILQGTRPILVEIQSLVVPTKLPFPKRIAQGISPQRFEILLAVLTRRCGLPLYEYDCFLNVAGGISINRDPSADLAICLSIASSFFDKALSNNFLAVGEVGLLGDIRQVVAQEKRAKDARRLGFKHIITNKDAGYVREAIKKYLK